MEETFWVPFLAGTAAATVTVIGVLFIRYHEAWARKNAIYFCSFAAGVLISVSFLHMMPRAIKLDEQAPFFVLFGFLAMHALNRFISVYLCDERTSGSLRVGVIPLVGIGLHSLLDGVIYSVTFKISALTGTFAAIGMVLHEFPEGIFTYVLLLKSGMTKRAALWLAILGAGATTPLGVAISYPFVAMIQPKDLAAMLALAAGALVYVGATHLLPMAEREAGRYSLVVFLTGILVALGVVASHH